MFKIKKMGEIKRENICIGDNREEISSIHINIRSINKKFEQLHNDDN